MTDRYPPAPGGDERRWEERIRRLEQILAEEGRRNPLNNGFFSGTMRNVDLAGNTLGTWGPDGITFVDTAGNVVAILDGNGLRMFDSAGTLRARIGFINSDVGYGVSVFGSNDAQLFEANDDGLRFPTLNTPWVPRTSAMVGGQYTPITDAAFVDVYSAQFAQITHGGFSANVTCTADVGTTGEFRLSVTGGATTSAVTVPSGSAGTSQLFEWLHGVEIGAGPVSFHVQARRTGGAGNVNVFVPWRASMMDPLSCSATGL